MREKGQVLAIPSASSSRCFPPHPRLFYRYQDLAPQLVPLDYTSCPDVKVPYELIGSMPELKVCVGPWGRQGKKIVGMSPASYEVDAFYR